jgi:hypothetical protein
LEVSRESPTGPPESILAEATRLLYAGHFAEARTLLVAARLRFPKHPALARALAQLQQRAYGDAFLCLSRAAALDPAFTDMSAASIACIIPGSSEATPTDVQNARRHWARSPPVSRSQPLFRNTPARAGERL